MTELLIQKGANVNVVKDNGETPVMYTVYKGNSILDTPQIIYVLNTFECTINAHELHIVYCKNFYKTNNIVTWKGIQVKREVEKEREEQLKFKCLFG